MADPDASPAGAGEPDLRALIQARVAARRTEPGGGAGTRRAPEAIDEPAAPVVAAPVADPVAVPVAAPVAPPVAAPVAAPVVARPVAPRSRHSAAPGAPTMLHRGMRTVVTLVVIALAVIGLRSFVVASYYIPSASMETTLHGCQTCEPDMVLVDKASYRFRSISRSDVVVFDRPPLAPPEDKELIKRVIGLPGDVVSGHDGHVWIGDRELVEPYVNPACKGTADFAAVTVPAGRYFMMGDNRCDSLDSRVFGTVAGSAVVGRAFAVMWPVKHWRWL